MPTQELPAFTSINKPVPLTDAATNSAVTRTNAQAEVDTFLIEVMKP